MTVTSVFFLGLLACGVMVYYLVPAKAQWIVLLGLSLIFYYYAATPYTIVFLMISTGTAYMATNLISSKQIKNTVKLKKIIPCIAGTGIVINVAIWFVLKGSSFWTLGGLWGGRVTL